MIGQRSVGNGEEYSNHIQNEQILQCCRPPPLFWAPFRGFNIANVISTLLVTWPAQSLATFLQNRMDRLEWKIYESALQEGEVTCG